MRTLPAIRIIRGPERITEARELFAARIAFEWGINRSVPEYWFNNDVGSPEAVVFGVFVDSCLVGCTVVTTLLTALQTSSSEEQKPLLEALSAHNISPEQTLHWGGHALHPTAQRRGFTTLVHYYVCGWALAKEARAVVGQSPLASYNPRAAAIVARCGMSTVPGTTPALYDLHGYRVPMRWIWKTF